MTHPCETSTLTIPAQASYAKVAAAYVEAVAGHFGFSTGNSGQLGQALLITLDDIIARAFGPEENQEVQISCERLAVGLKISIREKGLPLAQEELASLAADRQTCPLVQLGDQFTCVRDLVDEASFHNLGRAGAEVHLIKYSQEPNAAPEPGVCPVTPALETYSFQPGAPAVFSLRPFTPADAQAVTRLLYRTYGYSYPFEHLYYPERLIELNADGSLQSLVAVSSQGELVGHVALILSKEKSTLAEIGAAVVHPDFRGHGCLQQLAEYALTEAQGRQLSAVFARPVTSHIYSQKVSEKLGFKPSGLLVGLGPAFLSFKKIHEDLPQRESMVLIYRSLIQTSPGKIFPPPRHRDFILKLYEGLGMIPEAAQPTGEFPPTGPGPGNMTVTTHQTSGNVFIKLNEIGPDTLVELKHNLKHLCQSRFEVIHLELDLGRPAVYHLVPQCESLGFFFAGILPGAKRYSIPHPAISQQCSPRLRQDPAPFSPGPRNSCICQKGRSQSSLSCASS